MCRIAFPLTVFVLFMASFGAAEADEVVLLVDDAPSDGLVVGHVDLTSAATWCKLGPIRPKNIEAVETVGNSKIPFQFVPDVDFDPQTRVAGTVILQLPEGRLGRLRLRLKPDAADDGPAKAWDGIIATPSFKATHTAEKLGGLPSRIEFTSSGKVFDTLRWHDRTYHRELGGFNVIHDPRPAVELVADKSTKAMFDPSEKVGARVHMATQRLDSDRRGMFTRLRGDCYLFGPPFVTTELQIDEMVENLGDAIVEVLGS